MQTQEPSQCVIRHEFRIWDDSMRGGYKWQTIADIEIVQITFQETLHIYMRLITSCIS